MKLFSRTLPAVLSLIIFMATPLLAKAQVEPPMPAGISQTLSNLADQPAAHTGLVFDRSMLQMARGLLQADDPATRRAVASLSSISFDNYRYSEHVTYTPQAITEIGAAYKAAGWNHLVDAHGSQKSGDGRGMVTDLWLHFSGSNIDGLTVMVRGSRAMNMIQVACNLRPLDLLRLSGHFGIPKIDPGAVMVPAPDNR